MKRILSILLVLVMAVSLLPASSLAASSTLKASAKIMNYIKSKEGCVLKAYKLPGEANWTIGYGHSTPEVYEGQTISQAQADAYFAQDLKRFENAVNGYNSTYGLRLTQNEFDALVSFTYNCGTGWTSNSWRIARYLKAGFKDANGNRIDDRELADAFGVISSGGSGIMPGLIIRRIEEAKIFLYGDYDGSGSTDFVYVICDANGGTMTEGNRVVIYIKGRSYGTMPGVTRSGYVFAGWKSGSTYITGSTIAAKNLELTAVWSTTERVKYKLTVTDGHGSGSYYEGDKVYITPLTKSGFSFTGWTSSGVAPTFDRSNGAYYITMPAGNISVTANYKQGCIYSENCPSLIFNDVSDSDPNHEGIDFCVSNGILKGLSSDMFCPDYPITRGMLALAMYRAAGSPVVSNSGNPYTDVNGIYRDAAIWASANRLCIESGYNMFLPDKSLTRQEAALILYRFAYYLGSDPDASSYADLGSFPDSGDVYSEYCQVMEWACARNIIVATDAGTLEPESIVTRAEAAAMLYRFMQLCSSL